MVVVVQAAGEGDAAGALGPQGSEYREVYLYREGCKYMQYCSEDGILFIVEFIKKN